MEMETDKHNKIIFEKDKNLLPQEDVEALPQSSNLKNKPTIAMATGNSTTDLNKQSNNFKDNKENEENFMQVFKKIDKMINLDIKEDEDDLDLDDISFDEHNYENDNIIPENVNASKKHLANTNIQYRSKEDMEFKGEVDTPIDMNARDRFKNYR